jgi:uncharacterized membrane protein
MSTVTTSSYAEAVGRCLDDLPMATAAELLEGLGEHLAEMGADDFGSLVDLLGPPESYAAELRASAGLPSRAVFTRPMPQPAPVSSEADTHRAAGASVTLGMRHVARFALVVVGVGALVALYASRRFIDPWVVVVIALAAGAGLYGLRWVVAQSKLAAPWTIVGTVAVIGLALAAAASLGAAARRRDYVVPYNYPVAPASTVAVAAGPIVVPDFRHLAGQQAIETARAMGLEPILQGEPGSFVVNQVPLPGSLLDSGSSVLLITDGTPTTLAPVTTAAPITPP